MRSQGARFKATQVANIRCNTSCLKKNLVFSFSDPGKSSATLCILRFFDSSSSRVYCDNATKVMCVANVIFGQERQPSSSFRCTFSLTALFSLQNGARFQASSSLSTHSFCESILFVHLKALRGGELRLVRTAGMVRLDEILFEMLSKKWH